MMNRTTILVIEDDLDLAEALTETLELAGFDACSVNSGEAALARLEQIEPGLLLCDVNMPGMDGHQLLQQVKGSRPMLPVVLMTAYGSIEKAVQAMRQDAADYLVKPFSSERLIETVRRHLAAVAVDEHDPLAEAASSRRLLALAQRVAQSDSNVLICGESGTGKEELARFIHRHSPRASQPFVAINCAAIPENMLEATLFGHEKGAFTGAYQSQPGKFEQANGGTLLLDEISEMALPLQAKILRVLQEREVERIGGRRTLQLDLRILATTNRLLHQEVEQGRFREDLYYRLSVFPLEWLPLRERHEDILPLARRLLARHAQRAQRPAPLLTPAAERALLAHPWPGNVRELDNVLQRALILQEGCEIDLSQLHLGPLTGTASHSVRVAISHSEPVTAATDLGSDVKSHEHRLIMETLRRCQGSRRDSAQQLGISERTLRYKLAQMREAGLALEV
ncbi:MAG TPA: sigma-54 dependent transcriptional regulator [Pseudomonadales bacterium]|nr:sigma-54 dependent transcriptional regulator [Pseudomonadales bacterium]